MGLDVLLLKPTKDFSFDSWADLQEGDLQPFNRREFSSVMMQHYPEFRENGDKGYLLLNQRMVEIFFGEDDQASTLVLNIHGKHQMDFVMELTTLLKCRASTFEGQEMDETYIASFNQWRKRVAEPYEKE